VTAGIGNRQSEIATAWTRQAGLLESEPDAARAPASQSSRNPSLRRTCHCRFPIPDFRFSGFTLIELLVALAVFAVMAALAYGGLDSIVRTRGELMHQQESFRGLMRSVALLERDLRQAAARPVRGNYGEIEPALLGQPERIELTRAGFANPQAEVRATLERVGYAFTDGALQRVSYAVLDRAPTSAAQTQTLASVDALRLRYLDGANRWSEAWPPRDVDGAPAPLPRAIELRIDTKDYGEITRIVELVSPWPARAVEATP
jgi:general secretion pathway protein J